MARHQPTNVDDLFRDAMREIGAKRPYEIDPECVEQQNADLVFTNENTIAEVKTLMEDPRDKKNFDDTYRAMYLRWFKAGKVPPPPSNGILKINTASLPEECSHEFLRQITRCVKTAVEKANKQIKRTKEVLQMPNANGLLVLCNSGNSFLQPDVLLYGLHHVLGGQYSSINWFIYFTHELPVQLKGEPEPVEIFGPLVRSGFDPIPQEFSGRIRDAWINYVSKGAPVKVRKEADHRVLFDAKHLGEK